MPALPVAADSGIEVWIKILGPGIGAGLEAYYEAVAVSILLTAVVLCIETVVFVKVLGISWPKALGASLGLNAISAAAGFFTLSDPIMSPLILIVGFIGLLVLYAMGSERWFWLTAISAFLLGYGLNIVYQMHPGPAYDHYPSDVSAFLLSSMFFHFGLTLITEGIAIGIFRRDKLAWKGLLIANIASYIFLLPAGLAVMELATG